jgi:hypothetical protein
METPETPLTIEESKVNLKSMGTCYEWMKRIRRDQKSRELAPLNYTKTAYNWDFAVYDIIAGITVGLTIIPQGIAYAAVVGLPLQVKKNLAPKCFINVSYFLHSRINDNNCINFFN